MFKLFLILLIFPFLLGADIPAPPKDDEASLPTQQYLKTIYEEIKRDNAAAGIILPPGAVFFMITGSCPTGSTDVTSTYSDKFLRINATQGSTGGSDTVTLATTNLPSHNHGVSAITVANESAHTHPVLGSWVDGSGTGGADSLDTNTVHSGTKYQTEGGTAHTHTLSGNTDSAGSGTAATITNPYVTCKLCQVD